MAGFPGPQPQGAGPVSDALQVFSRQVLWIRIQHFKWIRIQSGSRASMTKNKIKTAENFFLSFFDQDWNLLILRTPKRTSKQQEKPSALKREHPALQTKKFFNLFLFCGSFFPPGSGSGLRIRIRGPHWIRIRSGYGLRIYNAGHAKVSNTNPGFSVFCWGHYLTVVSHKKDHWPLF